MKWDIAKNDVRQDQHQLLKDKVVLQQQLIKKQDALAQAKRAEMESEERKVCFIYLVKCCFGGGEKKGVFTGHVSCCLGDKNTSTVGAWFQVVNRFRSYNTV